MFCKGLLMYDWISCKYIVMNNVGVIVSIIKIKKMQKEEQIDTDVSTNTLCKNSKRSVNKSALTIYCDA